MHTLSIVEMELVAGAGTVADAAAVEGALGGAFGVSYAASAGGMGATAIAAAGGIGAAAGAGVAAAGALGYAVGTWLNDNTDIQQFLSNILPNPAGTDYSGTDYH